MKTTNGKKIKKLKYEAPAAVSLGAALAAEGARCAVGPSATNACQTGSVAVTSCGTGGRAGTACATGTAPFS